MTTTPATAASALMTFYDIESLDNAFTMCAYTPTPQGGPDQLEVFYLLDDDALHAVVDHNAISRAITASNPGLPASAVAYHDLRTDIANLRLAQMLGLSDSDLVCDRSRDSSFPDDLRPVCDTDKDYHPEIHPFLAGYNSFNYDTTMLALYLSEVFADLADYPKRVEAAQLGIERARDAGDLADARALLSNLNANPPRFTPAKAKTLREHNNTLFSSQYIDYMPGYLGWESMSGKIRMSMMRSGRHLDVARLNELQQKVGLKRLLGMLGYQIKESEKLGHNSVITDHDELAELLAYNVSDCLGLSQLFTHDTYSSAFDLKSGLLQQFPDTVRYKGGSTVRRDRLTIDSSSAKFVGRILSPQGNLADIEAVSFNYPHPEVAEERGIPVVNVLDECVDFFQTTVVPQRDTDPDQAAAWAQFKAVVDYYKSIEGKNFNGSDEYRKHHDLPDVALADIPKTPNNVPYFLPGAKPSSCFVTFSYGGIHGAEADVHALTTITEDYETQVEAIAAAKAAFPDAVDFVAEARRQHNILVLPDGSTVDKATVLTGSDPSKPRFGYRKASKDYPERAPQLERAQAQVPDPAELLATQRPESDKLDVVLPGGMVINGKHVLAKTSLTGAQYRDEPSSKPPAMFRPKYKSGVDKAGRPDQSTKLAEAFTHTSADRVIHEDFTSYYPNLLRNMRAFYNPKLGEDRYEKIFFDKERYGREMKTPGISAEEKTRLNTLRNGTKLILNSASGAGDAQHDTPIRMNNQIISMRIIGQLFSWRIGQAQTSAGARIISTNTDGLYSILDEETNNRVLTEQSAAIGVDIEPEPMFLISKDSNNRLELLPPEGGDSQTPVDDLVIDTAGGATLACHGGPRPDKALAHPAVIDFALARYLQAIAARGEEDLRKDFDPELGMKFIAEALDVTDPVKTATLFQNVVAASRGSITYPFAADPIGPDEDGVPIRNPRSLQMINRVFIVRYGTPGALSLHNAGAWKVTPASQEKRAADPEAARVVRDNKIAIDILATHGWAADRHMADTQAMTLLPEDQDVVTRKINSIDPTWSMVIANDDLHAMAENDLLKLLTSLDLDVYVQMLGETFTESWKNPA